MAAWPLLLQGDNGPVDVVEIGSTQLELGGVYKVKPLGEKRGWWYRVFGPWFSLAGWAASR